MKEVIFFQKLFNVIPKTAKIFKLTQFQSTLYFSGVEHMANAPSKSILR